MQRFSRDPHSAFTGGLTRRIPAPHEVQRGYWVTGEERLVTGRATRIFTFAYGCRDRERSVLCIPPLACTGRIFSPLAPLSRDHRLLMWTAPVSRRGGSACAEDVSLLGHPDFPLPERFAVVASGLGCRTALRLAAEHPERITSLALFSPIVSAAQVRRIAPFLLGLVGLPRSSARAVAPLAYGAVGSRRVPEPAMLELLRQARRFEASDVLRRLKQAWREPLPDLSRLQRIRTFLLWGALDPFCGERTMRALEQALPGSSECLDDAGHVPFLTHPVWVNARLQALLAAPA